MTSSAGPDLDDIATALDLLRDVEARGDGASESLSEAQSLVRSLAALGLVRQAVETVAIRRIAALEQASSLDPEADPARAAGHSDVGSLLAELWRTSLPAARQLCAVARATAPRYSLHGEELPPEFPELAQALLDSNGEAVPAPRISAEQAAVIIRELAKTGPGCSAEQRAMGERALVEHAPGFTVEHLRRLAVQVRDRLDQDGTEPREELQRRRRSLTITTTREGMTHIDWYLDAESAGHVVPQITAYVGHDYRTSNSSRNGNGSQNGDPSRTDSDATGVHFTDPEGSGPEGPVPEVSGAGPDIPESRSLAQLRSDGAVEVFRHRAGCSSGLTTPPVTMIVRVALADLRSGAGTAEIDEVPNPVSTATARRLAADANLIPMVLGRDSEVLDLGRSKRLFSPAQRHALAERDGGCAWTGCPHPPAYAQAHHIRWWDRDVGPTDLKNGILLCSHHHHRVHDDGWDITVRDNAPWFTPPAHHDPSRTPRRGGRVRIARP